MWVGIVHQAIWLIFVAVALSVHRVHVNRGVSPTTTRGKMWVGIVRPATWHIFVGGAPSAGVCQDPLPHLPGQRLHHLGSESQGGVSW